MEERLAEIALLVRAALRRAESLPEHADRDESRTRLMRNLELALEEVEDALDVPVPG